jgi:hypothetical protein
VKLVDRNKKREYLIGKINEHATYINNENFRVA